MYSASGKRRNLELSRASGTATADTCCGALSYRMVGNFVMDGPTLFFFPHNRDFAPFKSQILSFAHGQSVLASVMQAANRLQKALRTGSGLTFGAWQMLPGSNHSRTIARCGFDWVLVDTEHGNIDGNKSHLLVLSQTSQHDWMPDERKTAPCTRPLRRLQVVGSVQLFELRPTKAGWSNVGAPGRPIAVPE